MSVDAVEGAASGEPLELEGTSFDYLSDKIHTIANYCIKPFWFMEQTIHQCFLPLHPGEYGQTQSSIQEVCRRIFTCTLSIAPILASLPFAAFGMALTGVGNALQTRAYRYVAGDYQGEFSSHPKAFHLNACMFPGALPCEFGGVTPANKRFDRLVTTIRDNDPDFVFLCEFNRGLGASMVSALKDRYNHFITDVGLNAKGLETSFFVAYRGEFAIPPVFVPFDEKRKGMNSGFLAIETPDTVYVTTHLKNHTGAEEDDRIQCSQLYQILAHIGESSKRVVLMGDLNFERDTEQYQLLIDRGFVDFGKEGDETCTNAHEVHLHNLDKEITHEAIDYMLVRDPSNKKSKLDLSVLPTYTVDEYLHEALSDHHALIGVLA